MVTAFSAAEKDGHEILHACSTTIWTSVLPFWSHGGGGGITSGMSYIEIAVG